MTVGGGRGENSTRYYVCTACKQATDPAPDAKAIKLFRITRNTRQHVWLRWVAYSTQRRGLSMQMTWADFHSAYLPHPKKDGLDEQLFFKRHHQTTSQVADNQESK